MIRSKHLFPALLVGAFALSACTDANGVVQPKTTDGAIIGGILGGILGATSSGNKGRNVAVGIAAGAAIGGLIGQQLDKQADELRASLSSDDIGVVNTGSELIVTLPQDITFETDSATVTASMRNDLRTLAQSLNAYPDSTVDIFGHTDNVGSASHNQRLSADRAGGVLNILVDAGVDQGRLRAIGRGEDDPVASNLSAEGRARNRRVEIVIRPIG